MEKTILVCDTCEAAGKSQGAVDSVRVESLVTGKTAKLDLCSEHRDALFTTGQVLPMTREPKATTRTFAATMRCPVCLGYDGPGQGMFQHYRHHHPDHPFDEAAKESARAAFAAAQGNGRAKVRAVS